MRIFNLPLKTKSNNVPRFCGLGEVTKMFEYPKPTAAAIASPNAADLPRPLAAVRETVRSSFLSVAHARGAIDVSRHSHESWSI